jgi:hypothetical protein
VPERVEGERKGKRMWVVAVVRGGWSERRRGEYA